MIGVHREVAKRIQLIRIWKRIGISFACLIGLASIGGLAGAMQADRTPEPEAAARTTQKLASPAASTDSTADNSQVAGAETNVEDAQATPSVTVPVPEPVVKAPKSNPATPVPEPVPSPTPEPEVPVTPTPEPVPEPVPEPEPTPETPTEPAP